MGALAVGIGKLEDALPFFKKALDSNPTVNQYWLSYAEALIKLKRFDEATKNLQSVIKKQPDFLEAHYNLGILHTQNGSLNEAMASYKRALEIQPNYAEAHYNLGNIYLELDKLDEAEANFTRAITLNPSYAEAHSNLGVTLHRLKRLVDAEASYQRVIALNPENAEAYYNLGSVRELLYRLDEAEFTLRQAISLQPDYFEAHNMLGHVYRKLGRLDEAEASYRRVLTLQPSHSTAKHMLAATTGETTEIAPLDYVERLFDMYASEFDSSLKDKLEYRTPKIIADMIMEDNESNFLGSVMDLGCGTGLFGREVERVCEHLEGIDLSEKMLRRAKSKNIYDELIKGDILTHLANAKLDFNYFAAIDVFIYIGDLSDVFRLIKSRNEISGKLVFSTEDYDGDGFFLTQSGRYSHSKEYIKSLCEGFGYKLLRFKTANIRIENNRYVSGGLYLLDF